MATEARKLSLIEEVLKIDNEALLAKVEALLRGEHEPLGTAKPSKKYRGILNLSDEQRADLHNHLQNIRNEWERDI